MKKKKFKILVIASGSGSNFAALVERQEKYSYKIITLIANIENAYAIERARNFNIPAFCIPHKNFATKLEFETALAQQIDEINPDFIALAGFMRILSPQFTKKYEGRIINIHPSLLPKYAGLNTHQRAIEAKETKHGCTVHFVNEGVDEGAIIGQAEVDVFENDTPETLANRVLKKEHEIYSLCLEKLCKGEIIFDKSSQIIKGEPVLLR